MIDAAPRRSWWKMAIVAVLAIELLGGLSGGLSNSGYGNAWFAALRKPSFMPPGYAFGIVWPVLYALLGISVAMILAEPPSRTRSKGVTLFFIQMVLNFAWSPIFFAGHDIALAKYVIMAMLAVAAAAAVLFWRQRAIAGALMIPYLAWLLFATALNASIERLNPSAGASLFG